MCWSLTMKTTTTASKLIKEITKTKRISQSSEQLSSTEFNMMKQTKVPSLLVSLATIITLLVILSVSFTQQVSVINSDLDQHRSPTAPPVTSIESTEWSLRQNVTNDALLDLISDLDGNNNNNKNKQHSLNYLLSVISRPSIGDTHTHTNQIHKQQQLNNLSDTTSNNTINVSSLDKLRELLVDAKHDHSSDKVGIELANDAWKLMRLNAKRFALEKVSEARPIIRQLMEMARVSGPCQQSISHLLDRLENLDLWAIQSKFWSGAKVFVVKTLPCIIADSD